LAVIVRSVPTISSFYGVRIVMHLRDHAPPHFHAVYGDDEASIDVRTLEVIAGHLPRRALSLALEWASNHHEELLENWNRCAKKQPPKRIPPLP
jgi:hypothetical protein